MTKTDWTKEEVRAVAKDVVESISCVDPLFKARDMLTAYAERIEADESAVPVAWMRRTIRHKRIGGREEGERVMSASKVYPDDEPLFSHPPAQPAQDMIERVRAGVTDEHRQPVAFLVVDAKGKKFTIYNRDLAIAIRQCADFHGSTLTVQAVCELPPENWYCTKPVGHDGACTAWPNHSPAQEQPGWEVPEGYGPEVKVSRRCTGCKALISEPYQVQSDSGCNLYCAHPAFSHLDGSRKYIADSCRDTPDWCPAASSTPPKEN